VSIVDDSRSFDTGGAFADGPWLCQGIGPVPCVEGNWAVLGGRLVDGKPCGMGVREGRTPDSQCGPLRPTPLLKWAGLRCTNQVMENLPSVVRGVVDNDISELKTVA
jgi:hypothetical protein